MFRKHPESKALETAKTKYRDMTDEQIIGLLETGNVPDGPEHVACEWRINRMTVRHRYEYAMRLFSQPKNQDRSTGISF